MSARKMPDQGRDEPEKDKPALSRTPPHDLESEMATLGAILIDPKCIENVAEILRPKDFYHSGHISIFAAMLALHRMDTPPDLVTLCGTMRDAGTLPGVGGPGVISKLMDSVPTSANVEHYAKRVEATARLRRAIAAEWKSLEELHDASIPVNDRLAALNTRLEKASAERKQRSQVIDIVPGLESTIDEAEAALAHAPIYVRGGQLVRPVWKRDRRGNHERLALQDLPDASLLEELCRVAQWTKPAPKTGHPMTCDPPEKLVKIIAAKGEYPSVREVVGIVDRPALRLDGSIASEDGWDGATKLLIQKRGAFSLPPEKPTRDHALAALDRLRYLVTDYPFIEDSDRTAWFALVLTLIGRQAIDGPTPAFAISAPERGAGKSLLGNIPSILATGSHAPRKKWHYDEAEQDKTIATIGKSGVGICLFDNVTRPWGNDTLVACLDAPGAYEMRQLGSNTDIVFFPPVFIATGTNLKVDADMGRRTIPIQFDPGIERPDERGDETFTVAQEQGMSLESFCFSRRGELVQAALTLWAWWMGEGRPTVNPDGVDLSSRKALGSFHAWSSTVRAILWAIGEGDACEGCSRFRESADAALGAHQALMEVWIETIIPPPGAPDPIALTARELVTRCGQSEELADVVAGIDSRLKPDKLNVHLVGMALARLEGRVSGGLALVSGMGPRKAKVWSVVRKAAAAPF